MKWGEVVVSGRITEATAMAVARSAGILTERAANLRFQRNGGGR